ncbi:MAG: hypothetical protein A2329_08825 [Sulfurimonas sp. RIFOXYB2_FULL_37_5]|nr:MAG: hypothetical protein A2329_08825 [Sulfurimonas sp. RIFOXYB2_FULL_37_5]
MQWTNNLKIAVIENDIVTIGKLIQDLPAFENMDDAREALALIQESMKLVDDEKIKMIETMKKMKQTKAFLQNQ